MAINKFPETPSQLSVLPGEIYTGGYASIIPSAGIYYSQPCQLDAGYYIITSPSDISVTAYIYTSSGSIINSGTTESGYCFIIIDQEASNLVLIASSGSNIDFSIQRSGQEFSENPFTSSTIDTVSNTSTYTVPPGTGAVAFLVGGGGGGNSIGAGGGSGYAAYTALSCGSSYPVVIGAGGSVGGNGGTTTIGGVSASGGFTGGNSLPAPGGAGGSGGGGSGGYSPGLGGAGGTDGAPGASGTQGLGGDGSGHQLVGFEGGTGGAGGVYGYGGGIYAGGGGGRAPLGGTPGSVGGGGGGNKSPGGPGAVYIMRW